MCNYAFQQINNSYKLRMNPLKCIAAGTIFNTVAEMVITTLHLCLCINLTIHFTANDSTNDSITVERCYCALAYIDFVGRASSVKFKSLIAMKRRVL